MYCNVLCVLNVCKSQQYPGLLRSYVNRKIDLIKKTKKLKNPIIRGTAGRRSPTLIHKWNNLTVHYAGLIPPTSPSS